MIKSASAMWMCICMITAVWMNPMANAEDKTNKAESKSSESTQQTEDDIWQEISFEPDKNVKLTDKQIEKIFQDIKQSDPEKAKKLEKLKETDPKAFTKSIQEEIQKQVEAEKQPQPEPDARWKKQLEQKHEEFLKWYKKNYPQEHRELIQIQKSDPEKFAQKMLELMQIYGRIQWMENRDPKLAGAMKKNLDLQKQRDTLLLQIRISPEEEQAKLIEELKVVVSERFDTIVQEKQLQFEWLRNRLKQLNERLQSRAEELDTLKKTKDQSVQARLKELIERTEQVNWN